MRGASWPDAPRIRIYWWRISAKCATPKIFWNFILGLELLMHFLLLFYFIVWIFLLVPTLNMKKNASKLSNNLLQRPTPKRPPCVQPSSLNLSLLLSTKKVWCVLNFTESRHSMLGKEGLLCTRLYREPRFIGVYFIKLWKKIVVWLSLVR